MPKKKQIYRVVVDLTAQASGAAEAVVLALQHFRKYPEGEELRVYEGKTPAGLIVKPEDVAVCDSCNHAFVVADDNDFANITNLNERIAPGEMVPIAECPKCGALAHPLSALLGQEKG